METLYIINPENFNGTALNTMPATYFDETHPNYEHEKNSTYVHYSDLTFKQYNEKHENKLIVLTWDKFNKDFYTPYLKSLQGEFSEITEKRYFELLECVPPRKWHDLNENINMFFVGECFTADLYACCIMDKKTKKYYSALRSINAKDDVLINDFLNKQ